jgi:hypothetical protein
MEKDQKVVRVVGRRKMQARQVKDRILSTK